MNKKNIIILLGILLVIGIVIAIPITPPNGVPLPPPIIQYSLPVFPPEQSPTQIFSTGCPYKLPIELQDLKVYDVNGTLMNPLVTAQIRLYTGDRSAVCSFKKTYSLGPVINGQDVANGLIQAINQDLLSQAAQNLQPTSEPNPISMNG